MEHIVQEPDVDLRPAERLAIFSLLQSRQLGPGTSRMAQSLRVQCVDGGEERKRAARRGVPERSHPKPPARGGREPETAYGALRKKRHFSEDRPGFWIENSADKSADAGMFTKGGDSHE